MFRIIVSTIMMFIFLTAPVCLQPTFGMGPTIKWKVTGLGKPSSDPVVASNGLMYFPSGSKLSVLDNTGMKMLDIKAPSGSTNICPVSGPNGSIFIAGGGSVQEIKSNGCPDWSINIATSKSNATSSTFLASGPGNLLYLPLPAALYAIDTNGKYKWSMAWDTRESNWPLVDTKREILACTASNDYLYVVYGINNGDYTLAAVTSQGKFAWRFGLGNITGAGMVTDPDGNLYVTAYPKKIDLSNKSTLYLFKSGSTGSPSWSFTTRYSNLTCPALSGKGQVYFSAPDYLFAINTSDGHEIWQEKLYLAKTRPVVDQTNGKIYLGTSDGRLLAVRSQGRLIWDLALGDKSAVQPLTAASGELYVETDKGALYKITDTSPGGD